MQSCGVPPTISVRPVRNWEIVFIHRHPSLTSRELERGRAKDEKAQGKVSFPPRPPFTFPSCLVKSPVGKPNNGLSFPTSAEVPMLALAARRGRTEGEWAGRTEGWQASERASERACENGDESGAQLASPPTYFPLTGTAALALKLALSESERSGRKTEAADGRARERGKCGGKGKGHGRRRRQDGRLCKALRQWVTCRNKKAEMQDGEYKIRRFTAVSAILILTKG